MAYTTKIGLGNFRVFKEMQNIDLENITVFTGTNNSGKSSVIKALYLLTENSKNNNITKLDFNLGEEIHKLGEFKNILNDPQKEFDLFFNIKGEDLWTCGEPSDLCSKKRELLVNISYKKEDRNGKLEKIKIFEVIDDEKNKKILEWDINSEFTQNYFDKIWFYNELKGMNSVHFLFHENGFSSKNSLVNKFQKGLPNLIGEDFFKEKLNKFNEKDVQDFIIDINKKLLRFRVSFYSEPFIDSDHWYKFKKWDDEEKRYKKNLKIRDLFSLKEISIQKYGFDIYENAEDGSEIKVKKEIFKDILAIVGETFVDEIIKQEDLNRIISSVSEFTEKTLNRIFSVFNFDFLEAHKTDIQRAYFHSNNTPFAKMLRNDKDLDLDKIIQKEKKDEIKKKEKLEIDKKYAEIKQKKQIKEYKEKGYKIKMISNFAEQMDAFGIDSFIDFPYINKKEKIAWFENIDYASDRGQTSKSKNEIKYNFLNYWIGKNGFNLGTKIQFRNVEYAMIVELIKNGRVTNIADLGTGANQIIALLTKIILMSNSKVKNIIVEEPEINLHPNLQSKLADLFVDANKKFGIKFIIETHSEYLIRKLQYLTAKKVIKPEDVAVYYFNDPKNLKEGEEQVINLKIREDGMMDKDFGSGFFDESVKLTTDLLKIQNFS
ncbi:MAG: hypothetical protein DRI94_06700 [Bacteroidetes bacterium]|nr:MAG: hypothetical protein DRI94_06700 [Bacteroidota bacterium]